MKSGDTADNAALEQKLDTVIGLLQHLVALEMAKEGTPKQAIAKHLHLAKAKVVSMLQGVKLNGGQQ